MSDLGEQVDPIPPVEEPTGEDAILHGASELSGRAIEAGLPFFAAVGGNWVSNLGPADSLAILLPMVETLRRDWYLQTLKEHACPPSALP